MPSSIYWLYLLEVRLKVRRTEAGDMYGMTIVGSRGYEMKVNNILE